MTAPVPISFGAYRGALNPDVDGCLLTEWLKDLELHMLNAVEIIAKGRSQIVRIADGPHHSFPEIAVKKFAKPGWPKSMYDANVGSKARRSWEVAWVLMKNAVGTPRPIAFVDRWQGCRLTESYYLSVFEPELSDLRRELIWLYREDPICWKLMNLLETTAMGIRSMHDAGVMHRDLGNQNIGLRRVADGMWSDVMFIDLNRARIKPSLSLSDRARDISRLHLPSDLLRIFIEMYFGARPPKAFECMEKRYRSRYTWHTRTHNLRHPVRRRTYPSESKPELTYPDSKNIWIWDDRSVQAINVLGHKERNRQHSPMDTAGIVFSTLRAVGSVAKRYRRNLNQCFKQPVDLSGRIGMIIEPSPENEERELAWLSRLGSVPILVRLYHHDRPERRIECVEFVERIAAQGHRVAIAIVQDRRAVRDPHSWSRYVETVLERLHHLVDWVEIGHAVNRVKWGIWNLREYRDWVGPLAAWKERFPSLHFMGPAAIDFEYPFSIAALARLPSHCRFSAMSHHLYVDRRGAPENTQGSFALLEKCALARAIAGWSKGCDDRLIVSEVNWPLHGTGVYSPVVSPHDTPGPRINDPSVSEDEYAAYMIRYLLIALCSSMVERVYWWRLVARGFGLIDDTNPKGWRPRPAFSLLKIFLQHVGSATFFGYRKIGRGTHLYLFRKSDLTQIVVGYSTLTEDAVALPFTWARALDAYGKQFAMNSGSVRLPGMPVYFHEPQRFDVSWSIE